MTIYVSTGYFSKLDLVKIKKTFNKFSIQNIEFTGGRYNLNIKKELKKHFGKSKISFHNYFPPPKKNFVINLASNNEIISNLSLKQIFKSIQLCSDLNIKFFSFHAGFLIDPYINELGKKITIKNIVKKNVGINNFLKNLEKIVEFSIKKNVIPLLENNVSSLSNFKVFKRNVFLMSDPEEILLILKKFDGEIKLLLDVGHFKVSSNTLNFKKKDIKYLNNYVYGYHLSDNNGLEDLNSVFTKKSWFWKYFNKKLDYYVIEIYEKDLNKVKNCYDILETKLSI